MNRGHGEGEALIVALPARRLMLVVTSSFFLACLAWILAFCNFFCRLGNLVAGFLTTRFSFLAITCSPFNQAALLPFLGP
jgi:hypothetical protein